MLAIDVTIDGPADFAGPISGAAALTTLGEVTLRGVNTFQGPMIAAATEQIGAKLRDAD